MGRDPIGACRTHGPSQSCPPTRASPRRRTRGGQTVTHTMTTQPEVWKVIVGVDTHKHVHVAVAIDTRGIRLGDHSFVADSSGYQALLMWAHTHGRIETVRHRRHRQLWCRPGAGRPPSGASCHGRESRRPALTPSRRQIRHDRRRGPPLGPCWRANRPRSPRPLTVPSRSCASSRSPGTRP